MIKLLSISLAMLAVTFAGKLFAQELPATDIWLAKITNGLPTEPVKINDGSGYNNQPHFSKDGSVIYYTREMPGGKAAQTDIAAFNIKTSMTIMVNNTSESEYSPTPIPGRNALSVIQVEADQKQRLWAIDVATGNMDLLLADVEPVGYHAWINDSEVAMFILGDSFTLQTARLETKGSKLIADNIGRSIRKHPQTGEILFVDKNREPWQIAAFDPETTQVRGVMPLFPANEDFTIDKQGNYWSGNGSKLYKRSPVDSRWKLMADFKTFGINHISRLAINLNGGLIALVSDDISTG
jgi:hypothetical protein